MNLKSQIERFQLSQAFSLWKFVENERNYPGWNCHAPRTIILEMRDLLSLMEKCQYSSRKKLGVTWPSQDVLTIPNNRGGRARWKTVRYWILASDKTAGANSWRINETQVEIEIVMGNGKLQ